MSIAHKGKKPSEETRLKQSLAQSGSKSHLSKLTYSDVQSIKHMLLTYKRGDLVKIAKLFSVSVATISYIKLGFTWNK